MSKYPGEIEVFLNKEAMNKMREDHFEYDSKTYGLPKNEYDLLLGELNSYFLEKEIIFTDFDEEIYDGEELKKIYNACLSVKDKIPKFFEAIEKAYTLETIAFVYM